MATIDNPMAWMTNAGSCQRHHKAQQLSHLLEVQVGQTDGGQTGHRERKTDSQTGGQTRLYPLLCCQIIIIIIITESQSQ